MKKKGIIICTIALIILIVFAILILNGTISFEKKTATERIYGKSRIYGQITFKGYDKPVKFELYPDVAPITVDNFVSLAKEGFYDGLTVHRISNGNIIQMGDPKGDGTGGSDKQIKGEFTSNGVENNISHIYGVMSMARARSYDSASSQFFIVTGNYMTDLDGDYAAFGKVIDGFDTLSEVDATKTVDETPISPPIIDNITIED